MNRRSITLILFTLLPLPLQAKETRKACGSYACKAASIGVSHWKITCPSESNPENQSVDLEVVNKESGTAVLGWTIVSFKNEGGALSNDEKLVSDFPSGGGASAMAGDWDKDGVTDIAISFPSTGVGYAYSVHTAFLLSKSHYQPVTLIQAWDPTVDSFYKHGSKSCGFLSAQKVAAANNPDEEFLVDGKKVKPFADLKKKASAHNYWFHSAWLFSPDGKLVKSTLPLGQPEFELNTNSDKRSKKETGNLKKADKKKIADIFTKILFWHN